VLLDRDGVINRMRPDYVKRIEELELLDGAVDAAARLSAGGRDVVVITNQSAIGRGLVSAEVVDAIHGHIAEMVRLHGGRIRAFLICPHTPDDHCDCRKPAPGLILRARDELGIDLERTVVVGDQLSDLEAATAAGCDAILVAPDPVAANAAQARGAAIALSLAEAMELIDAA